MRPPRRFFADMSAILQLRGMPRSVRWAIVGAVSWGVIGAIVGLVVGLFAYAPTAWFAVFELGIPAAIAGGIVGLIAGLVSTALIGVGRLVKRSDTRSS
jgi:hypothetical protein